MSIPQLNYTAVPNIILDDWLPKLSGSELKIILVICRKTIGWHKNTDKISYSQLESATGLRRASIASGLKSLSNYGLVKIIKQKNKTNEYDLWFDNNTTDSFSGSKNEPVSPIASSKNEPVGSSKIEHTKESVKKNILNKTDSVHSVSTHQFTKYFFDQFQKHRGYKYQPSGADWGIYKKSKILDLFSFDQLKLLLDAWITEWQQAPPDKKKWRDLTLRLFCSKYTEVDYALRLKTEEFGTIPF